MSAITKVVEFAARYLPDAPADPLLESRGYIGQPRDRVDGHVKVTGAATFTAEYAPDNLAHAALVCSQIASGRVTAVNTTAAEAAPGVVLVITHSNAPRMKAPEMFNLQTGRGAAQSDLPILQDDRVHWNGQPIAVVVANTLEQAAHAASLIKVEYAAETPRISFETLKSAAVVPKDILGEPPELTIGEPQQALADASARVDEEYRTPWYNHNAIEPHATMALWSDAGDTLTIYDTTQCLKRFSGAFEQVFGLASGAATVVAPFVGGAFGGKAALWHHSVLCAVAARMAKRPVRLVLTREQVYRDVGGRTLTDQRVAIGADADGRLTALIHTGITATADHARYAEQLTFPARHLYASKNLFVGQKVVNLDIVANTWMRAPGESVGTFGLECAIDELAYALQLDPIELRRRNEPDQDPTNGKPHSSRHLIEAYARGAKEFGWNRRGRTPRSQRDGEWLIGQGVATAYYPANRVPASARIVLRSDGTASVSAAAHEMGMGTATVQIQHAAERLGLRLDKVSFEYGDSSLPDSPLAGGSCQTISIVASVHAAADQLHKELVKLARGIEGGSLADATVTNTHLHGGALARLDDAAKSMSLESILRAAGQDQIIVEASSAMPKESMKYSMESYGAQFCEVRVREGSGEVRVSRWLGSFDCGRILNPKTAASQLRGGIVMGIGMALGEETLFDKRSGRIMNPSLSEYHVPVNLDVPHIDILFNDIADEHTPLGAHGVGEIGITGAAAAIANAVYHATGKRVRSLPITLDKLL